MLAFGIKKIADEDQLLVEEFLKNNKVNVVQPSSLTGSEICRATRQHIAEARRAFRRSTKQKKTTS